MGQFERTLIIADEGSQVHYVEGCTAPTYSTDSLHSAVVEIIVKKGARVRYTTIQNWSNNVYNLVTKRAAAYENAVMEWVDGNLGSKLTMKYPCVYLMGRARTARSSRSRSPARGSTRTPAARSSTPRRTPPRTIISKSISKDGGRTSYRGLLKVYDGCEDVEVQRALRRAAPRRRVAARTRTRTWRSTRSDVTSGTRRPSPRSATSSSST